MPFATQVAQARKLKNLQQGELATTLEAKQQTVSRWEQGLGRPREVMLAKLARVLDTDENELRRLAGYPERVMDTGPAIMIVDRLFPVESLLPDSFERFIYFLLWGLYPDAKEIRRQGKTGHKQDGVDVWVIFHDGSRISFQCKRTGQFGPAAVEKAIVAHTADAKEKYLMLSRPASPDTAEVVRKHPEWTLWDKEDLSRLIRTKFAKIDQIKLVDLCFPGKRMALLGVPEVGAWQMPDEFFAAFSGKTATFTHDWPLVGQRRKELVSTIADGLATQRNRIVFLGGDGGLGKSRLLKDIAARIAESPGRLGPLFLSPHTQISRTDLAELGDGPKVVIVDDAHDRVDLQALFGYAALHDIRILVALRPFAIPRLRGQLGTLARTDFVQEERLERLSRDEVEELASTVLAEVKGNLELAGPIAAVTQDCPLVTVLAARITVSENLPLGLVQNAQAFRDTILGKFATSIPEELAQGSERKIFSDLLKVISLVQPVGIDDPVFLELASAVTGHEVEDIELALNKLVSGGILFKRGKLHRLVPDLLGDYIIEQTCIGTRDNLTTFARRVFEAASGPLLGNTLLNLGRLDWRRTAGDTSKSDLITHLWRALRVADEYREYALDAASAVAFYQPIPAIEFVTEAVRRGERNDRFSEILKHAAFNIAHVKRVCRLLWDLGRNDGRGWPSHPGHPLRVLKELCAVMPHKPIAFNEAVVEFGLSLLADPRSFKSVHTPLDFLVGILEGDGHTTEGDDLQITMKPFFVRYEAVEPLRKKVVAAAIQLLRRPPGSTTTAATGFLDRALSYPLGQFGSEMTLATRDLYTAEFQGTLEQLHTLVKSEQFDPLVLVGIAKAVRWHSHYADDKTNAVAKAIIAGLPKSLEFRMTGALTEGFSDAVLDRYDPSNWHRWLEAFHSQIVKDLNATYPTAPKLREFIEQCINRVTVAKLSKPNTRHAVFGAVLHARPDFAVEMCGYCLEHIDSLLVQHLGEALGFVVVNDIEAGRRWARRFLDTGDVRFQQAVGEAMAHFPVVDGRLAEGDRETVLRVLGSRDGWVVRSGLNAFGVFLRADASLGSGLLRHIDLTLDERLADSVLMYLQMDPEQFRRALGEDDARFLLSQLRPIPRLEGHWVETLLANLSRDFAVLTFNMLRDRVEDAANDPQGYSLIRPVNYGPYVHVPMQFKKTAAYEQLMEAAWKWLGTRDASNWRFEHNASALFDAMFLPIDQSVIAFLSAKLPTAAERSLKWIAAILSHGTSDFVFDNQPFVASFLDACDQQGQPVREAGINGLVRASIAGSGSGWPGEPHQRDVDMFKEAEAAMARLSPLSPLYELFNAIRQHCQQKIAYQRRDRSYLDD